MRKETGVMPAVYDVWLKVHTKSDGTPVDEVAAVTKVCKYLLKVCYVQLGRGGSCNWQHVFPSFFGHFPLSCSSFSSSYFFFMWFCTYFFCTDDKLMIIPSVISFECRNRY